MNANLIMDRIVDSLVKYLEIGHTSEEFRQDFSQVLPIVDRQIQFFNFQLKNSLSIGKKDFRFDSFKNSSRLNDFSLMRG